MLETIGLRGSAIGTSRITSANSAACSACSGVWLETRTLSCIAFAPCARAISIARPSAARSPEITVCVSRLWLATSTRSAGECVAS